MPTLIASLLRKAALLVLMLLALSLAVFYISRLTPGDPLQSYYGDAVQSMSSAELDAARRGMSEAEYQQEFECSFAAAVRGASYAA